MEKAQLLKPKIFLYGENDKKQTAITRQEVEKGFGLGVTSRARAFPLGLVPDVHIRTRAQPERAVCSPRLSPAFQRKKCAGLIKDFGQRQKLCM
jgi:hypothetical protein